MPEDRLINQCSVVLTRNCNLRCNFCYVQDAGYCSTELISLDNLKKIVDFCCDSKVKYIFFTGGEPLLYPFLKDILLYIKEKEHPMKTAVASNGILLDDFQFCKKIIDNGLDYIDISLKGKDQNEWLVATGYDGYYRQKKAITNLSLLKIDFTCSMVVNMTNVYSLCYSVKNAIDNGAKNISFTFEIDNSKKSDNSGFYLEQHNPFELIKAFMTQIEQLNNITNDWWIEYSFPLCVYSEEQLALLEGKMANPCQVHKKNAITFDTQLNILPCDMYFNDKIGQLGRDFNNVSEFFKLKENGDYRKIIDNISRLPSKNCAKCKDLNKCFGGCPVLWNNYSFEELMSYKRKNV